MAETLKSARLKFRLRLYKLAWFVFMPVAVLYFWKRGLKDSRYRRHLKERFGRGPKLPGAVWVHAVSIGEVRSSVPLVEELLNRNYRVVVTCLTPAGRTEAERAFATSIQNCKLVVRYAPLEYEFAFKRFFSECAPQLALVMEIEFWPVMIEAASKHDIPLFLCNSQYPKKSYDSDRARRSLRRDALSLVAGAFAKSEVHAGRFRDAGVPFVESTGEMRFDQPVQSRSTRAAGKLASKMKFGFNRRPVVAFASVVAGEDAGYVAAMKLIESRCREAGSTVPFFVYIPRAPERFSESAEILAGAEVAFARRSEIFDRDLSLTRQEPLAQATALLGDSLGEMNFYLAFSDIVVVGGGFVKSGAHNIIEPLAHGKPVLVGPNIWTIEHPAIEAIEAGAVVKCETIESLTDQANQLLASSDSYMAMKVAASGFHESNRGATRKTLDNLPLAAYARE